jgi:diketogulonate reductase-like aldo/keto reductase
MHSGKVIAIPKASSLEHMRENAEANLVELTQEDMQILSKDFQPPRHRLTLDIV